MVSAATDSQPVLILGAGVNGCAVARELLLNGIPVVMVDSADVGSGATARSSRLIHGGLRYLEYGDFRLVRESLHERSRLRKLAPQFVEPLRLYIPVGKRFGGLFRSVFRFLSASRLGRWTRMSASTGKSGERGLWLIRIGLWLYDRFARDGDFPKHSARPVDPSFSPNVDPARYRWLCSYTDAQMIFPERFVIALLEDARQAARESGAEFRLLTYRRVHLDGKRAIIRSSDDDRTDAPVDRTHDDEVLQPALVINATGAWGDLTLKELNVASPKIFGGTKGSHFVSYNPKLRAALGAGGVYAEAGDGRLVFVLPFSDAVLVGTTDERFDESPQYAVASKQELNYLIRMVNELFADVDLTTDDIDMHYSGVRPLPKQSAGGTASISRGHWIVEHKRQAVPVLTLVGGKLTTARAFAEEVAKKVCRRLHRQRTADSKERPIPGGRDYPRDAIALDNEQARLAKAHGLEVSQIQAMWRLCGNRVAAILEQIGDVGNDVLTDTDLPRRYVRWVIEHEWVTRLEDLVERRLMLVYRRDLSLVCLRQLAGYLVEAGRMSALDVDAAVESAARRLETVYGRSVN